MPSYIDFKLIKERVSFPQAIQTLGLQMRLKGNQYRSECPTCKHGGDRALTVTLDKGFYCHSAQRGGDIIAFVAHVMFDDKQREAAQFLSQHIGGDNAPTCPPAPPKEKGEALKPLDYLTFEHEVLELLGLSPAVCEALGAGYAPKGTVAGRIAIPLRLKSGQLVGYVSIATKPDQSPLIQFPKNLGDVIGGVHEEPQAEEPEKRSSDDMRRLLRVV